MFSISDGFIILIFPSAPSIKTNGVPPFIEDTSLTFIVMSDPGAPPVRVIVKPGTSPCNAEAAFCIGRDAKVFESVVDTAPPKFAFLTVPYPTTTNSSRASASSFNAIDSLLWFPTLISWLANPI